MIGRLSGRPAPTCALRRTVGALAVVVSGLVMVAGLLTSCSATEGSLSASAPGDPAAGAAVVGSDQAVVSPGPVSPGSATPPSVELAQQAPDPVAVRIAGIGVDAPLIPLGLEADGSVEVPEGFDEAGWWRGGPEPGEPGPAVIYGHVDSRSGPAVFFRLRDLVAGDRIEVARADGSVVAYEVDRIEQHPKAEFPTDAVYRSDTDGSVLRLVTCGGEFDRSERSYIDNVIVFASPVVP